MLFKNRGAIKTTSNVVIVDIDDKSLKQIGQFPWSRNTVAKLVSNLTNAGVGAIGFDIVFAEKDKTSPIYVLNKIGIPQTVIKQYNIDYDKIFANVLSKTPTILGYVFDFDNHPIYKGVEAPMVPAIFIQKGKKKQEFLLTPSGVIKNVAVLQNSAYSSGFFNVIPDEDGVVRSVPLAISYDLSVYPSLALEMIRAINGIKKVQINYNNIGIENIQIGSLKIPTDIYGRLAVNFRGPSFTFKYISASDILNNTFKKEDVKGKIVLIGTSAAGLLDLRNMPLDSVYPGVEVHANVIDNILKGDFITNTSDKIIFDIAIIIIVSLLTTFLVAYSSAFLLPFIIVAIASLITYYINYMLFTQGVILAIVYPLLALILSTIVSIISNYFLESKQKKLIQNKFSSKVSPKVMEDIIKNAQNGNNTFIAKEHNITVTFSDIRNFTNISEAAKSADILIHFLNEYMDDMTNIITQAEGTVDKFIGDAIMSYWNAPISVTNHVQKAVDASLDQIHAVKPLNQRIKTIDKFKPIVDMSTKNGKEPIEIGIGVNVGVATVGEMGSKGRSDYTIIGDPVNLGARLEALCKYYNSMLNISTYVKDEIDNDKYIFRFLDLVTVKGQSKPVEIWQIHDYVILPTKWQNDTLYNVSQKELNNELEYYHQAIKFYKNSDFNKALKIFEDIQNNWNNKTNNNIYNIYIQRCEHYIQNPPENFNGVFEHTTKG